MQITPTQSSTNLSPTTPAPTRAPRGLSKIANWSRSKKITAGVLAAGVAVAGWALFRPELLLVNSTVRESLPVAAGGSGAPMLLSQGGFRGLGHHAEGRAEVYRQGERHILRLSDGFATSNGPDVRVYLVEGSNGGDNAAIKAGKIIDLGVIKGNIGGQNYALPASFDPAKYASVSIWCKRFAVNFAAASLVPGAPSTSPAAPQATPRAAVKQAAPIVVTSGAFRQVAHATKGTATITEDSGGNRILSLRGFRTSSGPKLRVYLLAAEQVGDNSVAKKLVQKKQFVDLGALKSTNGAQSYAVPKGIDLWKFLSVGIWCDGFDVLFGVAPLSAPDA